MSEHEAIKAAKNAYSRAYYAKNKERIKANQKRYWAKKRQRCSRPNPSRKANRRNKS